MVKVIGVGDCMVDKNLTNGMMYPGGQALNIAVNTKLCGAQSAFIGAFGEDVYKRQAVERSRTVSYWGTLKNSLTQMKTVVTSHNHKLSCVLVIIVLFSAYQPVSYTHLPPYSCGFLPGRYQYE